MKSDASTHIPPRAAAIAILVLAVVAVYFVFHLKLDNRIDRLLDETSEEAKIYNKFLDEFGNDEMVIIVLSGRDLFDYDALDEMVVAHEALEQVTHVSHVSGIPAIYLDRFGGEDAEALQHEMMSTPFYHGLFISPDGKIAGLLVQTHSLDEPGDRKEMVEGIREAVAPLRDKGFRVDMVGVPIFNVAINEYTLGESLKMFPVAAVAALIVLLILVRSVRAAVVILFCGGISVLLTLGVLSAFGKTLNVVTSSIPVILWVLSLAGAIHIVCRYQFYRIQGHGVEESVGKSLEEVRFACSLSAATTALGFLSLVVADIGPVKDLGFLMALGLLIALVVNVYLGPHLLIWLSAPPPRWFHSNTGERFERLGRMIVGRPRPFLVAGGLVLVVGLLSLPYVESDPNSLNFLPKDSEIKLSYNFVAENLTGMTTLEIAIDTPGGWLNPEYWPALEHLKNAVESEEHVARVISPLDFLKKMNQWDHEEDDFDEDFADFDEEDDAVLKAEWYVLPESGEEATELFSLLDEADRKEIDRLVSRDGERIRMSALVKTLRLKDFTQIRNTAETEVASLPEPLGGIVTGIVFRSDKMAARLVITQLKSFGLAFVLVFCAIFIGLRSTRITIASILPNILPILTSFSLMVLFGLTLDAATVMVASIALGIAVDDTVHILTQYHRERIRGVENNEAIVRVLGAVGPSISVTTATTCIGFFCLAQSVFVPLSYFGYLAGAAIIVALIADIFFVPAMLTLKRIAF